MTTPPAGPRRPTTGGGAARRRPPGGSAKAAAPGTTAGRRGEATTAPGSAADAPGARPAALRLARVHLRLGSLPLARAELESLAGRGGLDEGALLDLAEVRWRTGDLPGAGEAAHALLERGSEDVLALVISAEAVAAEGRPGEARRLAVRAMSLVDGPLDPLFAGMPRSSVWPLDVAPAAVTGGAHAGMVPAPRAGRRPSGPVPAVPGEGEPASAAAAEALAGGLAALGSGDPAAAALRLGVALRLEPDYAAAVLEVLGPRVADPVLALVAGDAYRLLGREAEALDAFDRARGHG